MKATIRLHSGAREIIIQCCAVASPTIIAHTSVNELDTTDHTNYSLTTTTRHQHEGCMERTPENIPRREG